MRHQKASKTCRFFPGHAEGAVVHMYILHTCPTLHAPDARVLPKVVADWIFQEEGNLQPLAYLEDVHGSAKELVACDDLESSLAVS